MLKFINRESELDFLDREYHSQSPSLVIIYGRRRVGKTTLISEFIKGKKAMYFLADKETEKDSMKRFARELADFTKNEYLKSVTFENWRSLFEVFVKADSVEKKLLIIDELPYMVETNNAFPSILQWVWDTWLVKENVMLILCGSHIHMMEKHTLNYSSPLYGRRTGQIRLGQLSFRHYREFFPDYDERSLVEHYSVTGGVPRYIELFRGYGSLHAKINQYVIGRNALLYEEPEFLLRHEIEEIGSYFSIIKSIASGNHKLGKICADIGIKQTSLPKYLKTLALLDIVHRETPITETNPEKSKMGLYKLKDNFLAFWFRFIFPERSRIEIGQTAHVLEKIKNNLVDAHTAYVYENVCMEELWHRSQVNNQNISKIGKWWNGKEEIDIIGIGEENREIVFAECKFQNKPMDADIYYDLLRKKDFVGWNKNDRHEKFVLFSISGFTEKLVNIAKHDKDLTLV